MFNDVHRKSRIESPSLPERPVLDDIMNTVINPPPGKHGFFCFIDEEGVKINPMEVAYLRLNHAACKRVPATHFQDPPIPPKHFCDELVASQGKP